MKKQNWWILAAVVLLTVLPLWLVPRFSIGTASTHDGQPAEIFRGSDDKAQKAISDVAPDYKPWFAPLMEPASSEIASLLFALQAAIGAGVIGYWLGCAVTRDKLSREGRNKTSHAD